MTDVELKAASQNKALAHHVGYVSRGVNSQICRSEAAKGRLRSAGVRNAAAG